MSRIIDIFIHTRLNGSAQVWIRDGWNRRFDMGDDPDLRGVGWTADDVGEWRPPSRGVQLDYYEAVKNDARQVLSSLSTAQLDNRNVIGVQLGGVNSCRHIQNAAQFLRRWDGWCGIISPRVAKSPI